MSKWVCITKDLKSFTYGKIYEGFILPGSLLDIINDDFGERKFPRNVIQISPTKKVYYFISLDEWRQQQIETIL